MRAAYASYQDRMKGNPLPPMNLDYAAEITEFSTWVAELNGGIVGGLTMIFDRNLATVANVAVHPEFQGQGLGGGLMKFAEKQAIENSCTDMRLATHVLLSENLSLYLHLGWTEYGRDDTRVYLSKKIVN